jgi:hypothetical protein
MTGDPQSEIPSDAATGVNVVAVLLIVFAILVFFISSTSFSSLSSSPAPSLSF